MNRLAKGDLELVALRRLSAELGRNPLCTQAAGGNTSLKREGVLWIKASGTWLADAERADIIVPVALDPLLAALAVEDQRAETARAFVIGDRNPHSLRPSVETPVHAAIPAPVVVHVHCVATIATAVRKDAEAVIAARLDGVAGVKWTFIPYVRPGVPLARELQRRAATANVIVLGNHGLVVAAATVAAAADLLARVSRALDAPRRPSGKADATGLARLTEGSPYRLPRDLVAHDVATDAVSLNIARGGTLYPDHLVFLGTGVVALAEGVTPTDMARRKAAAGEQAPLILAVPGCGVLLHRDALRGADELARALAEVTSRIPAGAEVAYLTTEQEAELVDWEAERYRLSLAGGKAMTGVDPRTGGHG